jgi:hypothetical protein
VIGFCPKSETGLHVEVFSHIKGKLIGSCKYCHQNQDYGVSHATVWHNTRFGEKTEDKHNITLIWSIGHRPITRADH